MDAPVISGLFFVALVAVIAIVFFFVRVAPVNRSRRAAGLPSLRWREISGSNLKRGALADSGAHGALASEKESRRQIAWEEEQASQELIRTGSHIARTRCRIHDRWCFHAHEEGHPPGGNDNPRVPDDWPPDLRAAVQRKK